MNQEQLDKGIELARGIAFFERNDKLLSDDNIEVRIDRSRCYPFQEDSIELLPEEEEALQALRTSYITILRTANNRKLEQLHKEFEEL